MASGSSPSHSVPDPAHDDCTTNPAYDVVSEIRTLVTTHLPHELPRNGSADHEAGTYYDDPDQVISTPTATMVSSLNACICMRISQYI